MKKQGRFWLGCLLISVGLSMYAINVSAQTVSWEIVKHSTDINTLKGEVTEYTNQGYVPVGITYDNVELYILYVQVEGLEIEAWWLGWYDDRDTIQKGITDKMNEGYVPTGITYTGDKFYVLYVKTKSSATAWQLVPSALNLNAVKQAIQPYIDQGYVPTGISKYGKEYWTLLLETPDTSITKWKIETYVVGKHGDEINANIEQGYVPWGLEYRGKQIDILYVGF